MNDIDRYRQSLQSLWHTVSEDEMIVIVNNMDRLGNLLFQKYISNHPHYDNEQMNEDSSDIL